MTPETATPPPRPERPPRRPHPWSGLRAYVLVGAICTLALNAVSHVRGGPTLLGAFRAGLLTREGTRLALEWGIGPFAVPRCGSSLAAQGFRRSLLDYRFKSLVATRAPAPPRVPATSASARRRPLRPTGRASQGVDRGHSISVRPRAISPSDHPRAPARAETGNPERPHQRSADEASPRLPSATTRCDR